MCANNLKLVLSDLSVKQAVPHNLCVYVFFLLYYCFYGLLSEINFMMMMMMMTTTNRIFNNRPKMVQYFGLLLNILLVKHSIYDAITHKLTPN